MELVNPQGLKTAFAGKVAQKGITVWVIGPRGSDKNLIRITGLSPESVRWLSDPKDLKGQNRPTVVIMPNWWRHDYHGMEDILNEVEANVYNVYFGMRPNYKNSDNWLYKVTNKSSEPKRLDG